MRYLHVLGLSALVAGVASVYALHVLRASKLAASASDTFQCSSAQLQGYYPKSEEVVSHQQFSIPTIQYGFGTSPEPLFTLLGGSSYGFMVTLRVDESGKVVCYAARSDLGTLHPLNGKRREVIEKLMTSTFTPFEKGGQPTAALVQESIDEERLPLRHIDLPAAPQSSVHIGLNRAGCFGRCPGYSVELYGDGRVIYTGLSYVDVRGKHTYQVSPDAVAKLIEEMRTGDLWSLGGFYDGDRSGDMPMFTLMLDVGGERHLITDRHGSRVGMPAVVSAFMESVDLLTRSQMWIQLSNETLEQLKTEHFDFHSWASGEILSRAVENPNGRDEQAMRDLIALGAPLDSRPAKEGYPFGQSESMESTLEVAMKNRRASLVEPLIAAGALRGEANIDQDKLDAAFQAAIVGGNVGLVQKVWDLGGDKSRPSLSYDKKSWDFESRTEVHRRAPVALLLEHHKYDPHAWDGLPIIQFLVAKGCDITGTGADRQDLLHLAGDAGDSELLTYLKSQGVY